MDENKVNLFDFIQDKISCYDEYYAEEIGLNYLDDEDIYNIVAEILNNQEIESLMDELLKLPNPFTCPLMPPLLFHLMPY